MNHKPFSRLALGMFPLILTVLNRDHSRGYNNPYEGLCVEGGTSQVAPPLLKKILLKHDPLKSNLKQYKKIINSKTVITNQ